MADTEVPCIADFDLHNKDEVEEVALPFEKILKCLEC